MRKSLPEVTSIQNIQRTQKREQKTTDNPINKWVNELKRQFSEEEIKMSNTYTKKCSTSFTIKEMQIKAALRVHFTPIRLAIIKKITKNAGEDVGGRENETLIH
jgi:hypothetical protein